MYTPKYLKPIELVYEKLYRQYENQSYKLFFPFNPALLRTADLLRERYGSITVNTWHLGGNLDSRGLRPGDDPDGAQLSAHKFGAAIDCNFKNASAEEVRADMVRLGCFKPGFKANVTKEAECFKHINRVENTLNGKQISWFHFDIFNNYNNDGSIISLNI